jgi:DNA-binding transcriptional LysR family regulator
LRSFVVLAETRNFERAAKKIGRSQPAVSDQIKVLESALGIALFHRQTRSVVLTPEGEMFLSGLKKVLADLDDLLSKTSSLTTLEAGEVKVGASPTLACYILPEIIGSFRKKHPGIRILFSDEPAARLTAMVQDRELDFYFGPRPSAGSALRFQAVAEDRYVIVAPKEHPLVNTGCRDPRELARYPMLLMRGGTNVRDEIDRFFRRHRLNIKPVEEVSNHFTLGGLVESGCGLTLLPRSAHPVIAHPGTAIIETPDPKFVRVLGVATRPDYRPSPAAKAFLASMIPLVKDLLRSNAPKRSAEIKI